MFRIGLFIIKGLCIAFFVILNLFEDLPLKLIKGACRFCPTAGGQNDNAYRFCKALY